MARPRAYFAQHQDSTGSFTYARWQSLWIEQAVTWDSQLWLYQKMVVSGIMSGQAVGAQAQLQVDLTVATDQLAQTLEYPPGIIKLEEYHLDDSLPITAPQAGQVKVAETIGQVVQVARTTSNLTFVVGSALSPAGSSFVPRRATTRLIGLGLVL